MELEHEIRMLKFKKASQFENIEMLSSVNDSVYLQFGKTVAELMKKEKELLRQSENEIS